MRKAFARIAPHLSVALNKVNKELVIETGCLDYDASFITTATHPAPGSYIQHMKVTSATKLRSVKDRNMAATLQNANRVNRLSMFAQ